MKYLGIDYGTKRIGIAVSDEDASFAFPVEIVQPANALQRILEIAQQEDVHDIVVGYSLATNGKENDLMPLVERFIAKLTEQSYTVHLEREDFSSFEAHRYQTSSGSRDDSAAAIILQRFLDKRKREG